MVGEAVAREIERDGAVGFGELGEDVARELTVREWEVALGIGVESNMGPGPLVPGVLSIASASLATSTARVVDRDATKLRRVL